jgi:hypothetical protein
MTSSSGHRTPPAGERRSVLAKQRAGSIHRLDPHQADRRGHRREGRRLYLQQRCPKAIYYIESSKTGISRIYESPEAIDPDVPIEKVVIDTRYETGLSLRKFGDASRLSIQMVLAFLGVLLIVGTLYWLPSLGFGLPVDWSRLRPAIELGAAAIGGVCLAVDVQSFHRLRSLRAIGYTVPVERERLEQTT